MKWLCVAHEKEIPDLASVVPPDWETHAIGIGQFHSLLRFTELLNNKRPKAVVLAGTGGALDTADILRICLCNHFAFPSVPNEELPEFLEQNLTTTAALPASMAAQATVLQNYGISVEPEKFVTNTQKIPANFPRPIMENMEAVSLALACNRKSIPFSALLCVTNEIGPNAREQWRQNFRAAGERLANLLSSL